jgi:hypothetical protein
MIKDVIIRKKHWRKKQWELARRSMRRSLLGGRDVVSSHTTARPQGALKNGDQPLVSVGIQKAFRSSFANDAASLPWLHCDRGLQSR